MREESGLIERHMTDVSWRRMIMKRNKGFTLIELLVVIAIIGSSD